MFNLFKNFCKIINYSLTFKASNIQEKFFLKQKIKLSSKEKFSKIKNSNSDMLLNPIVFNTINEFK